jgi:hypothetical protein
VTSLAWLNIGCNKQYSLRNDVKNEESRSNTSPNEKLVDDDDYSFFTCSLDKTIKFYRRFTPVATLTEHAGQSRLSYQLKSQSSSINTSHQRMKRS